jgi:uncharacterized integral membrane protein
LFSNEKNGCRYHGKPYFGDRNMNIKIIIIIVLVILFGVILIQNTEIVTFQLLFWKIGMSRIILISFMLLLGFVMGYVVAKLPKRRTEKTPKELDQD